MASEIVTTSGTAKVVMITGENGLDSVAGHPAQTAGKRWRSVVFTRSCGVNDLGWRELTEVTVGEFDDAGAAWEKAKDAAKPGGTFGYTIIPVDPSGMETIADAEKIVAAARAWTKENVQSDHAELLEMVFEALSETLVRGSSEVDEALCRLQLTNQQLRDDHFGVAIGLLHRWQGRNGRIGNADPHHGRTSGAGEA